MKKIAHGTLVVIVIAFGYFQIAEHAGRRIKGPIGQDHYVVAVIVDWLWFGRVDNNGAIVTELFLET